MKMMTLFSMLFGAGLVLMGERSNHRGASLRGVYYPRCLWLLVIGLIHSYLIWFVTHSIVCTTLFYGYGFGAFGHVNRIGLAGIVLVIWIVQMLVSPIWLERFRFGPAEWLWRSLTYWKLQPMINNNDPC
jgi:uncharacterized membrane protein YeiB